MPLIGFFIELEAQHNIFLGYTSKIIRFSNMSHRNNVMFLIYLNIIAQCNIDLSLKNACKYRDYLRQDFCKDNENGGETEY